jgi:hypothetical protein
MHPKNRGGDKSGVSATSCAGGPTVSDAQQALAQALDRAVTATGSSNKSVGDCCGVSEKTMRTARDPLSGEGLAHYRALLLPRSVFSAYVRELTAEYERLHGPGFDVTPERQAHRVISAHLATTAALHAALEDGILDASEIASLTKVLEASDAASARMRQTLNAAAAGAAGGAGGSR